LLFSGNACELQILLLIRTTVSQQIRMVFPVGSTPVRIKVLDSRLHQALLLHNVAWSCIWISLACHSGCFGQLKKMENQYIRPCYAQEFSSGILPTIATNGVSG